MANDVLGLISLFVAILGVLSGFPMAFIFVFVALSSATSVLATKSFIC